MTQDKEGREHQQMKEVWSLWLDALEEDRRATFEELSGATGAKASQENAQEPTSVAHGWATRSTWQCSPAHHGCCKQKLRDHGLEMLPHAPYSPNMSPPDFDLYPKLKELMRRRLSSLEELSTDDTRAIQHMNKSGFLDGIIMLPKRWDSVIERKGDYWRIVNR